MIDALASNRANEALDVRILPRRLRCADHLVDAHILDPFAECGPVDAVAVAHEILRRGVIRERVHELKRGPSFARVGSHIEMYDATTLARKHDEDEEHSKRRR